MAVTSFREVIGRTLSHKFGEGPTCDRKFIVTLDDPATNHQVILNAVGIFHGAVHPEYTYLRCLNGQVQEGSPTPYHAEVTYSYEVPKQENLDPNPLSRPDVWSFATGGSSIPALFYYEGTGNGTVRPLVNSAKDFMESAMTDEAECKASIAGNRASFPLSMAIAVTNSVNSAPYLGAPKWYWKCNGISAQQAVEVVNDVEVRYWQITVELSYRQSGWPLQLPDVGYNCIESGKKVRAYVFDPEENTTKIPSANTVALNSDGSIKSVGQFPDILERRVHKEVDFNSYFGTPPF